MTLDPRLIKRVMRGTLALRGSFHWHALAGSTVYPVQTAVKMNIPLVIWGAHGVVHRLFDPLALWQAQCAGLVSGQAVPAGHFIPEELPSETTQALRNFMY